MDLFRILDVVSEPISEPINTEGGGNVPTWVYAIIIVGSALLLVLVALLICFLSRRKK